MTKRDPNFPNPTKHAVPRDNGVSSKPSALKPIRTGNSYGKKPAVKRTAK